MPLSRTRLYILLVILCAAGYAWIGFNLLQQAEESHFTGLCLIKHITGIPCPSCGSTRSVISLLHGNFYESLRWNPFGLIVLMILLMVPLFITYDVVLRKVTLLTCWQKAEALLKKPYIALPAVLLVLLNWIWNIYKGL